MSQITSYTSLLAAVAEWLNRGDLTAQIPGLVQLAEADILRTVRRKSQRAAITVSSRVTSLPADCAELSSIVPLTNDAYRDAPLDMTTPVGIAEYRALTAGRTGRPVKAAVLNDELVVAPEPDGPYTYEITYLVKVTPLSSSVQSNALLVEAPDAYLFGTLANAAQFLEHDERVPQWLARFEQVKQQLNKLRQNEEYGAGPLPGRIPTAF